MADRKSAFYPTHSQDPSSLAKYHASCHCSAIQFTFLIPALDTIQVINCNCSICEINGYLNVYPFRSDVVWLSTPETLEKSLGVYRFKSMLRQHKFCRECGTSMLIDFEESKGDTSAGPLELCEHMAVNVRTIKEIDLPKLKLHAADGRHLW